MSAPLICWNCGTSLAALSLPLLLVDECRQCHAQLHVCRLCQFYDIAVAKQCREPIAEEVHDKQRANHCDYFVPQPDAYSRSGLDAASKAKADLDSLFAAGKPVESSLSGADKALADLDALFGKK